MFVQVFRGRTPDVGAIQAALDRWNAELKPGATGYLGSTEGLADDGTYIAVVRFDSEELAMANSNRPEQGAWWKETSRCFEGPVTFYDCPEVDLIMGGGSDEAGFVQIMIYRPKDADDMRALAKDFERMAPEMRPDVLGGVTAIATDGTFIDSTYFTNEVEARKHESKVLPPDQKALFEQFQYLAADAEFLDLHEPRFFSA